MVNCQLFRKRSEKKMSNIETRNETSQILSNILTQCPLWSRLCSRFGQVCVMIKPKDIS